MHSVRIDGFKTKEVALEFIKWYSGQGEQDVEFWMECREKEGMLISNNFSVVNYDKIELTMEID